MVNNHFTIHVRLTNKCNASCTYCSAASNPKEKRLTLEEFKKSCEFIIESISKYVDTKNKHLTIQYVGGEILTYPQKELEECVLFAREYFKNYFDTIIDGVQTNLISSNDKIKKLQKLFGSRIGTSVENFSKQRSYQNSPELYLHNLNTNIDNNFETHPPANFVLDKYGVEYGIAEYEKADSTGYNITFNPAFDGKNEAEIINNDRLEQELTGIYSRWAMKSKIMVEPLFSLMKKRVLKKKMDSMNFQNYSGCPFQSNCHQTSINLDSNGDLYLCYEMADSKQLSLGNALTKEFNETNLNIIKRRSKELPSKCRKCDYYLECQGGCMSKSLGMSGNVYGLTPYCSTWMSLFALFDLTISEYGVDKVNDWLIEIEG
jgi:radical SAM protein with 4Fe4S-binding SPASM domain